MPYAFRILFIRHGETDFNAAGRLQGQQDTPLNGKGREQASAVGRTLATLFRAEIDRLEAADAFHCSPMARVRDTMELARVAMGLERTRYAIGDDLKELSFGRWEGQTWPEIEARDPAGIAAREKDKWRFTPPGGESYATLTLRLSDWLGRQNGDLFIASHGGVARGLMHLLGGVDEEKAPSVPIFQGRALVFAPGERFRWVG